MKLREIVVEKAILPELKATERDDAIVEMIEALVESGEVNEQHREPYLEAVLTRENRASTGLGHGVAVPHVKHPDVTELKVAIGISETGVDFNALDRQPVFSIFLLLSPADRPEDHLDAMQVMVKYLGEPTFRSFLRQADTVDDVLTLLKEADDKQFVH